jgi:hypothetical protein
LAIAAQGCALRQVLAGNPVVVPVEPVRVSIWVVLLEELLCLLVGTEVRTIPISESAGRLRSGCRTEEEASHQRNGETALQ